MNDLSASAGASEVVRRRLDDLLRRPSPSSEPELVDVESDADPDPDSARPAWAALEADRAGKSRRSMPAGRVPGFAVGAARRAFEFGKAHVAVVAIIALVGCVWAGVSLTQARTVPVAVAVRPSATASQGPSASPSPTPSPQLVVHVLGAVSKPGVVRLAPGARVQDALTAAGGLKADARPGQLNLAAPVADGAQIVVGTTATPGGEVRGADGASGAVAGASGPAGGSGGGSLVNLNTATIDQLDSLPGVGPVTAKAILDWRTKHGRFSQIAELQEVDGIGPKTYAQLSAKVTV